MTHVWLWQKWHGISKTLIVLGLAFPSAPFLSSNTLVAKLLLLIHFCYISMFLWFLRHRSAVVLEFSKEWTYSYFCLMINIPDKISKSCSVSCSFSFISKAALCHLSLILYCNAHLENAFFSGRNNSSLIQVTSSICWKKKWRHHLSGWQNISPNQNTTSRLTEKNILGIFLTGWLKMLRDRSQLSPIID